MTSAKKLAKQQKQRDKQRQRLIGVAVWAAGEHAKKELGLDSEWKQGEWVARHGCGTACCIAGKVALDAGAVPAVTDDRGYWILDPEKALQVWLSESYAGAAASRVVPPGGDRPVRVDDYAQELLGLSAGRAADLFFGLNNLDAALTAIRAALDDLDGQSTAARLATSNT